MNFKIKLVKDVKTPSRGHSTDAGIDFYIPNKLYNKDFENHQKTIGNSPKVIYEDSDDESYLDFDKSEVLINQIVLYPNASILIPSGVIASIPENHALIFFNKSGVATKKKLMIGASVVDFSYRGEMHIHLTNVSKEKTIINVGEKIIQGILIPINLSNPIVVEDIDLDTDRGIGGFGSTGIS